MIIKFQITISKFQTNPNNQNTNDSNKVLFGYSNLNFACLPARQGYCLRFGVWDLEITQ